MTRVLPLMSNRFFEKRSIIGSRSHPGQGFGGTLDTAHLQQYVEEMDFIYAITCA